MRFNGRGYAKPIITKTITATGVTLRVDCDRNPEVWAELHLSRADLEALLDSVARIGAGPTWDYEDEDDDDPTPLEVEGVPGSVAPNAGE